MNFKIFLFQLVLIQLVIGADFVFSQAYNDAPKSVIKVFNENDFWYFDGKDSYYTQGLVIEYNRVSKLDLPQKWPFKYFIDGESSWGVFIGQNIYTPSNIKVVFPGMDERPYAGWTYLGLKYILNNSKLNRRLSFMLHAGVIGSISKAEEAQKLWHKVIDAPEPLGWDKQISNDIGINVTGYYDWKLNQLSFLSAREKIRFEVMPRVETFIGTVFNKVGVGATAKLSFFKTDSYFSNSMTSTGAIIKSRDPRKRTISKSAWGLSLYGRFVKRAVVSNSLLHGGLFSNSQINAEDLNRLYLDLDYGITLTSDCFDITYSRAYRSKEFKKQKDSHNWGQIYLTFKF